MSVTVVIPALQENGLCTIRSSKLGRLGFSQGDRITITPLEAYFPGDTVLFLAKGIYQIGQIGEIRSQKEKFEIVIPYPEGEDITLVNSESVLGFVAKAELSVDLHQLTP